MLGHVISDLDSLGQGSPRYVNLGQVRRWVSGLYRVMFGHVSTIRAGLF